MASGEGDFLVDLECGGTTSEEEGSGDSGSGCRIARKQLSRASSGALSYDDGLISGGNDTELSDGFSNSSNVACETVDVVIEKSSSGGEEVRDGVALFEKRNSNESRKKPNFKKATKPPRPPKGPLLNASDLKLVKELSELAARKRARIERMRTFKKMKETKRATSGSNLTAMVITVLFFIVILFQGVLSGHHEKKDPLESPAPASEGLISVQVFNQAPANVISQPSLPSLNVLEKAYSSSPREEEGRDTA